MPEENLPKPASRDYYLLALRIIGDFGASIAVPVVILVLIGQYIDKKYNTAPLFIILAFVLAALISAKIIHKKAKNYGAQYKRLNDAGKKEKKPEDHL
ncbi:MAG: AtpZ/AtpI family protein [Candidatus Magasanikbacteria bacterium]|nr:AtpZ/AtpI family protein [Candidatus Magasanikbacteria bacterium]